MKKQLLLFILLLACYSLKAQDYLGYSLTNYTGVNSVIINPSELADSRYALDINLAGINFGVQNNFFGLHKSGFLGSKFRSGLSDKLTFDYLRDTYSTNFYKNGDMNRGAGVYIGGDVLGPSVLIPLSPKVSIAISTRSRTTFNLNFVQPELAELSLYGLNYSPLNGTDFTTKDFRLSAMAWNEIDFSYAMVIPVIPDNKHHFFKAGVTLKVLQGEWAAYLYGKNITYNFKNSDTLTFKNDDFQYGHTSNVEIKPFDLWKGIQSNWGVGADIGFTYEYRPNYESYMGTDDKGNPKERQDVNKYKLKIGLSVTDIGGIKFNKDPDSRDLTANVINWNTIPLKINSIQDFDDTLNNRFKTQANTKNTFYMNLPTAVNVYVDYMFVKHLYGNAGMSWNPLFKGDANKINAITTAWITPRYEAKWFGAGIPVSVNSMKTIDAGVFLYAGPLYIGSPDIIRNVVGADIKSVTIFAGLKIPIPHRHPKKVTDRDGDGVPDNIDDCPDVAGPKANHGCPWPDRDHDGVADKDDKCPDDPGPKENFGCPYLDTDKDGVYDKDDSCPLVAGVKENHGCPWPDRDKDGVFDKDDKCPDVAGPVENFGCPWPDTDGDGVLDKDDSCPKIAGVKENHGCPWPDSDGDGVLDKDDACPHTPGPASNHGCPVIEKKEEAIIKRAFSNLEFDNGKDIIRAVSYPSLTELADLLKTKPAYGLKLAGHTDNVGKPESNMKLSSDRATAVKNFLVSKGVSADRIVVEYYGDTRPIADNKTAAGRQKNRRVEMTIIFQ